MLIEFGEDDKAISNSVGKLVDVVLEVENGIDKVLSGVEAHTRRDLLAKP